jgi:hypothetical protein
MTHPVVLLILIVASVVFGFFICRARLERSLTDASASILRTFPLFQHMDQAYALILTESELGEIIRICREIDAKSKDRKWIHKSSLEVENERLKKQLTWLVNMSASFASHVPSFPELSAAGTAQAFLQGEIKKSSDLLKEVA